MTIPLSNGLRKLKSFAVDALATPRRIHTIERYSQQLTIMAAKAERDKLLSSIARVDCHRLEPFGRQRFSQFDEDGIVAEIFRRIGTTNKKFVEFGSANGEENNTVALLLEGWSGLWLEGSRHLQRLQTLTFREFIKAGRLVSHQAFVTRESIDRVILDAGFTGNIDLLSIDIDGNDFYVWERISSIRPRVVVIEYNAYIPPPLSWVIQYSPDFVWDGKSTYFGASLAALTSLGASKGYVLVGCNAQGINAFFVLRDCVNDLFPSAGDAEALYHPRRWWLDCLFRTGRIELSQPYFTGR